MRFSWIQFAIAMCAIVAVSNYLVQFPVQATLGPVSLADMLTWGAFTYPVAFFVTDITNRRFGPKKARYTVFIGFVLAVSLSFWLATPRIAIASGSAFLVAQLLDITIFDRLRRSHWWKAPLISTVLGSTIDTMMFFSIAFSTSLAFGRVDEFAVEAAPLLGFISIAEPRWVSWALGDLVVKLVVGLAMLAPYGAIVKSSLPVWRSGGRA